MIDRPHTHDESHEYAGDLSFNAEDVSYTDILGLA